MEAMSRCAGQASTSYGLSKPRVNRQRTVAVRSKLQSREIGDGWKGELPSPRSYVPGVLPGVRTVPTPILTPRRLLERLSNSVHGAPAEMYGAFYSSAYGGIVTDPGFMSIPIDDHFVHKGHGVYETVVLKEGYLYQLNERIQRLRKSADALNLTISRSDSELKRIILDTAAASGKMNGTVTIWYTAGRGSLSIFQRECTEPGLYVMAVGETYPRDRMTGFRAISLKTPYHAPPFGGIKNNNFLPQVLAQLLVEDDLRDIALIVDEEGWVHNTSFETLCVITADETLVYLPADNAIPSVTLERLMELIPEERERSPNDVLIKNIEQRRMHYDELVSANEVFVVGALTGTHGIIDIDNQKVGDGLIGTTTLALHYMLDNDQLPKDNSRLHTPVPYGYPTGMRDQLV